MTWSPAPRKPTSIARQFSSSGSATTQSWQLELVNSLPLNILLVRLEYFSSDWLNRSRRLELAFVIVCITTVLIEVVVQLRNRKIDNLTDRLHRLRLALISRLHCRQYL